MTPRQTRGKQAQQRTVTGNDPSLDRSHFCFSDVQIVSQRRVCSFHCSTESVCGGVCVGGGVLM